MHLPSRRDGESGTCASCLAAGQTATFPEDSFQLNKFPEPNIRVLTLFWILALLPVFPHFKLCGNTRQNLTGSDTRESEFSPLVNHCVHFHCVFMHKPFYDNSHAKKKKPRLNRKTSICQQGTAFSSFFFFSRNGETPCRALKGLKTIIPLKLLWSNLFMILN